jgi:hypothetical protein
MTGSLPLLLDLENSAAVLLELVVVAAQIVIFHVCGSIKIAGAIY